MPGTILRSVAVVLVLSTAAAAHGGTPATPARPATPAITARDRGAVAAGATIEQAIRGGEADAYRIRLRADESLHVVVRQRGIDLSLTLFTPQGEKHLELDSPTGAVGPEPLWIVAEESGDYRLEVRSLDASAPEGVYTIGAGSPRPAEPRDRLRVEAQSLHARGEALRAPRKQEELREALVLFGQARERWRQAGDVDGEVRTLFALGLTQRMLVDLEQALATWQEALRLKDALSDRGLEGVVLGARGLVHQMRGDLTAAEADLQSAAALFRRLGNLSMEGSVIAPGGRLALRLGEFDTALERLQRALEISRLTGNRLSEAVCLNDLGYLYQALGDAPRALPLFEQARALVRALGDERKEAATLSNLARLHAAEGDAAKAQTAFAEALRIYRELGDRYGEALTLVSLGSAEADGRDFSRARESYEAALALHRVVGDRLGEATALSRLAALGIEEGELAGASHLFEESLEIRRRLGHRAGEADALYGLARVRLAEGELETARQFAAGALTIVESLRTGLGSLEMRASYLGSVHDYYLTEIEVLLRLHERAAHAQDPQHPQNPGFDRLALESAERARARSLLDLLGPSPAGLRRDIEPALAEKERSLRRLLAAKGEQQIRLLARAHDPEQAAAAARQIEELTRDYDLVRAEIGTKGPRLAELLRPRTLTSREIQALLDEKTLLLEYTLGAERSYLWLVSRDDVSVHVLAGRAEIESAARRLHGRLGAFPPRVAEDAAADWQAEAALLSRLVLGPVAASLRQQRLAIVADGALQYVPFGVLGLEGIPLLRDHEVVSLPSASALAVLRDSRRPRSSPAGTVAVLADPVFDAADARIAGRARAAPPAEREPALARSARDAEADGGRFHLARLPFSRIEAREILSLVPASRRLAALDFDASLDTALGPELGRFRIVHFATHGLLNSVHPELSGIVLSLVDRSGREQPGFLSLSGVFDLQLDADLVVLSGCQTALGKEVRAEGLIGLTRGFLYAGASAVVASLWKVDDAATAEFMRRFYGSLLGPEALSPAAALRRAQLEMRTQRRWQHPYFWAAFVLQGEWD